MDYTVVYNPPMIVMGIECRTSNAPEIKRSPKSHKTYDRFSPGALVYFYLMGFTSSSRLLRCLKTSFTHSSLTFPKPL